MPNGRNGKSPRKHQARDNIQKPLSMTVLILLLFFAFGAAFIQRTTGFGFGIFIMTMLPHLMPSYGEATTLSGLLAIVTSAIIVWRTWRDIEWRKLLPILTVFSIVSIMAIEFLSIMRNEMLHKILGVTLIIASLYFLFLNDKIRVKASLVTQTSLGTISGLMGGFFGMQGPPAILYFLAVSDTKERYIAIAQAYFLIGNTIMTLFRLNAGFLSKAVVINWLVAIPAVFIGTYLGALVYRRIQMTRLRKCVYIYIGISGIIALLA